jgi:hypothetical protein
VIDDAAVAIGTDEDMLDVRFARACEQTTTTRVSSPATVSSISATQTLPTNEALMQRLAGMHTHVTGAVLEFVGHETVAFVTPTGYPFLLT